MTARDRHRARRAGSTTRRRASRWCSRADGATRRHAASGARACYVCKERYVEVDAFYHQLCPACAALNHARRDARTDLTGRRALLTGGRAKIGMYIALRLLRDGAHTTITTRFPQRRGPPLRRDAGQRRRGCDRLRIVGIDLRDPAQVVALADSVAAQGPLDILINNAAQTVRRSPGAYSHCVAASAPLPTAAARGPARPARGRRPCGHWSPTPAALTALALTAGSASADADRGRAARSTRAASCPTCTPDNSWTQNVDEVDPVELLEVQLCNMTAPFILVSRLRAGARRVAGAPQLRRERLGDGGPVQPRLQGPGPPAHEHGQGGAEHADPHQRAGDARATAS